jgi:uncharacterized membrane protein
MKNKNVGWLIIGISLFVFVIIWIFNYGIANVLNATCSMGPSCSMYKTLNLQTWISLAIAAIIFFIGLFFILSKENEKIVVKKIRPLANIKPREFDRKNLKNLDSEELKIMNLVIEHKGSVFQSEIVDSTGFGKVKVTRILDSLEAQGLIERKRRGMTNIVMIKAE